jgi:hypothetical protein
MGEYSLARRRKAIPGGMAFLFCRLMRRSYFLRPLGVSQLGKKVLATILLVCPLVALLLGLKYGLFSGGTHGSLGTLLHGYPLITPRDARRSMKS